jgi:kumamolisin
MASRHIIPGSERHVLDGAKAIGPARPDERIEATLRLRAKTPVAQALTASGAGADTHPGQRKYLTREQFAANHGADAQDLALIAGFAKAQHLTVVESNAARRSVVLSGTTQAMNDAFGVNLQQYEHAGGTYRGRTGSLSVPGDLAGVVEGVFGLDDRPAADPHFQRYEPALGMRSVAAQSFTPPALAELYDFPTGADGSGQCIGLIELGGGYKPADLSAYFAQLGVTPPTVTAISVDNAHNRATGSADGPDGEVMLDIEVAGAVANDAAIAVYFAPNTDQGFIDALSTAVHDTTNKPSVISISWGQSEDNVERAGHACRWSRFSPRRQGSASPSPSPRATTGRPTASPTGSSTSTSRPRPARAGLRRNVAPGSRTAPSAARAVWNDGPGTAPPVAGSAGSSRFRVIRPTPNVPNNVDSGTPGAGCRTSPVTPTPVTGYRIRVDGADQTIGGTSAVAPLWAALSR